MSKKLSPQSLSYDDIKNSLERHMSHEAGKQLLVHLMSAGDVPATIAKQSLKCKLTKGKIEVPIRSVNCRPHFECVDLRNYLECEARNSATIGTTSSTRGRQRPRWACPVCGEGARAEDLLVDDFFAHILETVPMNVDEVQLLPDGSFEEVSGAGPEVTIDDEELFEPQQEQLLIEPSGPSHAVEELLKQSKAFQRTLQNEKSFRTRKDLREATESFLEKERDALSALLKALTSANQARQIDANIPTYAFRNSSVGGNTASVPLELRAGIQRPVEVPLPPACGQDKCAASAPDNDVSPSHPWAPFARTVSAIAGKPLPIRLVDPDVAAFTSYVAALYLNSPDFAAIFRNTVASSKTADPSLVNQTQRPTTAVLHARGFQHFNNQPQQQASRAVGSSVNGGSVVGASPSAQPKLSDDVVRSSATSTSNPAEVRPPAASAFAVHHPGVANLGEERPASNGAASASDPLASLANNCARNASATDMPGLELSNVATNPAFIDFNTAMFLNSQAFAANVRNAMATLQSVDASAFIQAQLLNAAALDARAFQQFNHYPHHQASSAIGTSVTRTTAVGASPVVQPKLSVAGSSSAATSVPDLTEMLFPAGNTLGPKPSDEAVIASGQEPSTTSGASPAKKSRWCNMHMTLAHSVARHQGTAAADHRGEALDPVSKRNLRHPQTAGLPQDVSE